VRSSAGEADLHFLLVTKIAAHIRHAVAKIANAGLQIGAHHKTGARPLPGGPLNPGVAARDELIEIAAQDTCSGLERQATALPPFL
jgi:hypothetical protein